MSGNRPRCLGVSQGMLSSMPFTPRLFGSGLVIAALLAGNTAAGAQSASPQASQVTPIGSSAPVTGVSHPTGATDVVLRMDTAGGFTPLTYGLTQAPEFTLYGDGTVVFRPSANPEGDGFPPFVQATMNDAQMDALLAYALGPGGLRDARDSYQHRQITDQPTTVFSIDANGVDKSVAVYALGMTQPEGEDAAAYQGFQELGVLLANFGEQVAQGHAQDPRPYQPAEYRAFLSPPRDPSVTAVPWPWPELTIDDFQRYGDHEDVLVAGLTPAQAAQVTTTPSGGVPSIPILTPDGTPVTLSVRPLLPDESVDPSASLAP